MCSSSVSTVYPTTYQPTLWFYDVAWRVSQSRWRNSEKGGGVASRRAAKLLNYLLSFLAPEDQSVIYCSKPTEGPGHLSVYCRCFHVSIVQRNSHSLYCTSNGASERRVRRLRVCPYCTVPWMSTRRRDRLDTRRRSTTDYVLDSGASRGGGRGTGTVVLNFFGVFFFKFFVPLMVTDC
jgi:hypothetical protein